MILDDIIINWMEKQLGNSKLEERTIKSLLKGIFGRFLQFFAMYIPMTPYLRVRLQRARGVKIGKNVFIGSEVLIDPAFPELVTIEDDVSLAGRNILMAHSNPPKPIRDLKLIRENIAPITIEQGAWITVGAIILPGVTIGKNSIVSAGVVVTKNVPSYSIVRSNVIEIIKMPSKVKVK